MMKLDDMKEKVEEWMSDWKYGSKHAFWEKKTDPLRWLLKIYTENHCYNIHISGSDKHGSYMGCTASARKPIAGETWTRGSDLHDGPFSFQTWVKIMQDIIGYELLPISDYVREKKAENEDWSLDL